jgi:outer membrane protein assembly factor BamD (BamD/ComL family)
MISIRSIAFILGFLLLLGCPGDKAKLLLEDAAFEESHMNMAQAKKIYEELVNLYPTSKEAEIARARLEAMKDQLVKTPSETRE